MIEERQKLVVGRLSIPQWLGLSIATGILWLPLTFGSLIIPFLGPLAAMVLMLAPIIHVIIFMGKAWNTKKQTGRPSTGAIWGLAILQLMIILISCIFLINFIAGLPGGRDLLDIGGHIA